MNENGSRLNSALSDRYTIDRELGEGGMATVYLAHDLKHDRPVALKVLKPELAAVVGAERFLAEIKTTANLQHPHILPLFDSGEAAGFLYYVMPYVEGETLRDRLEREKQLPVDEAIRIAAEVADALQSAHEQGVIHRDIKPANILLSRGRPLVADFGIALAVSAAGAGRLTETGLSLGTLLYMSPEQATGEGAVDHRSDVFSLGCVLYEMLSGEPPFTAPTAQAILHQILAAEPDPVRSIRATVPEHVEHVLAEALEKLPADRFASASDFVRAIGDSSFRQLHAVGGRSGLERASFRAWTTDPRTVFAGLFGVLAVMVAAWVWTKTSPPSGVDSVHLNLDLGEIPHDLSSDVIVSRDGSTFAVASVPGTQRGIYVRGLQDPDFRLLPGTEDGRYPAFSPDGGWIVYRDWSSDALMMVALDGGSPLTLLPPGVLGHPQFPFWGDDGQIVFRANEGVFRISASGGDPELLLDRAPWAHDPRTLPGGRGVLLTDSRDQSILLLDLEADSLRVLVSEGIDATFVEGGHILYAHPAGGLFAVPFDPVRLEVDGPPVPVLEDVWVSTRAHYSISDAGTLVYGTGGNPGGASTRSLVEVELGRERRRLGLGPGLYESPRWSPDGGSIAYSDGQSGARNIFVFDRSASSPRQLTFEGDNRFPVWSPQGTRVAFSSNRDSTAADDLFLREVDSDEPESMVVLLVHLQHPKQWVTEDQIVIESGSNPNGLFTIRTDGTGLTPYLDDPEVDLDDIAVSPDGRWAAYQSNETGEEAVFVRSFPTARQRTRISVGEGQYPRWSPDGRTVYYWLAEDAAVDTLMAASVVSQPTFAVVDRAPVLIGPFEPEHWDLHPDGRRLLVAESVSDRDGSSPSERLVVVLNWYQVLRERLGG